MGEKNRLEHENLIDFASRLAEEYIQNSTKDSKKEKGQFFTPAEVAKYMAGLSTTNKEEISILDPGAGIGILSSALITQLRKNELVKKINLTVYETDNSVLPYLKSVLDEAKWFLEENKIQFNYNLLTSDFISSDSNTLTTNLAEFSNSKSKKFDIIISNPPYFKLNKNDQIAKFKDIISGQPNIYFLFMAISAKSLSDGGEMIYITPRSFCSGLYYSKFRKWLVQKVSFTNIHLFDSRKDVFSAENVLQESIITRFVKKDQEKITISKTFNGNFSNNKKIEVLKNDVIYKSNGHIFFRIPSDEKELSIVRELDKLPFNFYKLGIKVSTGKVVAFRSREHLKSEIDSNSVPLLWMHNLKNGKIEWPSSKKNKEIAIKNNESTKKLLLTAGNYLVLKRFTTKEQKKRFDVALIYKKDFEKYNYFALDNMINYVHSPDRELSENQIKGISNYLNLPIVESYFRILNGHTQVNANEINALPFPSLEQLEDLGKNVKEISILNLKEELFGNQDESKKITA